MMDRRALLRNGLYGAGIVLFSRSFASSVLASSNSCDSSVEILLGEPLGFISPNIYGHFTENLSGVIYDGIWVGKVPRFRTRAGFAKSWLRKCARSSLLLSVFREAVSPIVTIGVTESGHSINAPAARIFGRIQNPLPRLPITGTIQTSSEQTNSFTFAI